MTAMIIAKGAMAPEGVTMTEMELGMAAMVAVVVVVVWIEAAGGAGAGAVVAGSKPGLGVLPFEIPRRRRVRRRAELIIVVLQAY